MDSGIIFNYIQEVGYRTGEEIKTKFSSENQEILDMVIENLMSRNKIRKVNFQPPKGGVLELFYVASIQ